jgi:transcriptional regulator with XRE-family HTH domain
MEEYVRERITQLRLTKGLSEYQLSYNLGHSRGYINNISSGKSLPSMSEFFCICEYFDITPREFFDTEHTNPALLSKAINELKSLDDEDMLLILTIINRMKK